MAGENSAPSLFGHQATVVEKQTTAIVMVTQTQFLPCQSALPHKVAENPGTWKNAHLPWQQPTPQVRTAFKMP